MYYRQALEIFMRISRKRVKTGSLFSLYSREKLERRLRICNKKPTSTLVGKLLLISAVKQLSYETYNSHDKKNYTWNKRDKGNLCTP